MKNKGVLGKVLIAFTMMVCMGAPQTEVRADNQWKIAAVEQENVAIPKINLYLDGVPDGAQEFSITIPKGQSEIVQKVIIPCKGRTFFDLSIAGTSKGITVQLYSDEACTQETGSSRYLSANSLTAQLGTGITKKGEYWLKASVYSAIDEPITVDVKAYSYNGENRALTSKQWSGVYTADYKDVVYHKVTIPKNGYMKVEGQREDNYGFNIELCNGNKKSINPKKVYLSNSNGFTTYYGVKKGTYYIKVENISNPYKLRYIFASVSDQAGASKAKAVTIEKGKAKTGLVYITDVKAKADWFKVKLTKKQTLKLTITSKYNDTLCYQVIPADSKTTLFNDTIRPKLGTQTISSSDKLPAGTYYIKVTKNYSSDASGYYSIKLK